MRRVVLALVLLLVLSPFVAGEEVSYGNLEFHVVSTEEELDYLISQHNGEYFFIFYHSESCPACRYMKETVFPTGDAENALKGLVLVAIDVYQGRELTNLQYRVDGRVLVIQPDNAGYYTPKKPGEAINIRVPGTPTMVVFKAEDGVKILKGVAIGALSPEGLKLFVEKSIENAMTSSTPTTTSSSSPTETSTQTQEEDNKPNLSLGVLLTIFSAGILSVFSPLRSSGDSGCPNAHLR